MVHRACILKQSLVDGISQLKDINIKTEFMRGPGRCDTSHDADFNETWPK